MKNTFSLNEIEGWEQFQHVVGDYFMLGIGHATSTSAVGHSATESGVGPDSGKDIIVSCTINDSVLPFERKWVVQCKSYQNTVRLRDISSVNIPTLVHRHGANGYLLVSKHEVHNQIRELFADLNGGICKMGYKYEVWDGNQLHSKMLMLQSGPFFRKYFPDYQEFLADQEQRGEDRKIQAMIREYLERREGV
jgi:hypothetical protein